MYRALQADEVSTGRRRESSLAVYRGSQALRGLTGEPVQCEAEGPSHQGSQLWEAIGKLMGS
eukprot:CAMPEP_0183524680 /NCGR_PEP_ID=MMETSP0371-20130417/20078_1 /TAXON_ID=268820 /ORGANISM="Peridinium aciculiferum, Strain PAER-2" /LENGTH=61 /DNA_ID=CAMNT_0025723815 /DNA_START=373 /DNA_END=555 /DNA_ORIENTATION=+